MEVTLSNLYKSIKIQTIVYEVLSQVFKKKFTKILTEAKTFKPYLCEPAELYINEICEYFIEYGYTLKTYDDLELILNELKVWRHEKYNVERNKFNDNYNTEKKVVFKYEVIERKQNE